MDKKVSVIVNCHNGEKYLSKCIISILNQKYENLEIIFYDNFSNDRSKEIISTFMDKRVKYFYSNNKLFLYQARNKALEYASGKIIAFLDVDDWWDENYLSSRALLLNIFDSINFNFELNIVGLKKKITSPNDKVKLFNEVNSTKKIISFYDKCNIFVLPSYTEGAPKVIFESLARHRPIIVFEEIKHVKENFRGIFVCRRQTKDFTNKVYYIMKNYKYIIKEIKKNKIHTNKQFQNELGEFFQ